MADPQRRPRLDRQVVDWLPPDIGAICRGEVAQNGLVCRAHQLGVEAGDGWIVQHDVIGRCTTYGHLVSGEPQWGGADGAAPRIRDLRLPTVDQEAKRDSCEVNDISVAQRLRLVDMTAVEVGPVLGVEIGEGVSIAVSDYLGVKTRSLDRVEGQIGSGIATDRQALTDLAPLTWREQESLIHFRIALRHSPPSGETIDRTSMRRSGGAEPNSPKTG